MKELLAILEEEISIMEPEDAEEEATLRSMESALPKIRDEGPAASLTPDEREAVKYALEDVGELYCFTGTSAGFDTDGLTKKDVKEHQGRGWKAREQAAALGIHLGGGYETKAH